MILDKYHSLYILNTILYTLLSISKLFKKKKHYMLSKYLIVNHVILNHDLYSR